MKNKIKFSIKPKFKINDRVWFIAETLEGKDIFSGIVKVIMLNGYYQNPALVYEIEDFYANAHKMKEKDLFASYFDAVCFLEKLRRGVIK